MMLQCYNVSSRPSVVFALRHRASNASIAHDIFAFPSFSFTTLCRSHTHFASASRDSHLGGCASTSARKSALHVAHGYRSPSASKNRRACTRCACVGFCG